MNQAALAAFLDAARVERGLAENSLQAYRRDLSRYLSFLERENLSLENVSYERLLAFLQQLRSEGLSTASINRIQSAIRTFHKYLSKEEGWGNPSVELELAKLPRRLPKPLTIDQITKLIAASDVMGNAMSPRDKALIELLYGTGARVSEVISLNVLDIAQFESEGTSAQTVRLKGKGGKERIVPIGSFAAAAVADYLTRTRPMLIAKSPRSTSALFLNARGGRLSRQSAWQIILDTAKRAGIEGVVSPHVFRHSYATHLLDGGADIRVVQELLGHSSVTTTQIYTLITIDKVRESYAMAHPRAL
jgi:integrase/recombinase XerD